MTYDHVRRLVAPILAGVLLAVVIGTAGAFLAVNFFDLDCDWSQ